MKTQTEQSTIINNQTSYPSSGLSQSCGHKVRYQERTDLPVKDSTQDRPDRLPKDHRPDITSKVTVAFAVEEWFQICLTYLNYERSKTSKVLMPLPRAIWSD